MSHRHFDHQQSGTIDKVQWAPQPRKNNVRFALPLRMRKTDKLEALVVRDYDFVRTRVLVTAELAWYRPGLVTQAEPIQWQRS